MTAGPAPGRVLIVRVGAMGDVLHALPAAAALRRAWPEMVVDWVVDPRWAPLLVDEAGAGPVVSRVHLAETKLWSRKPFSRATFGSVMQLRGAVRAGRYELVVDMQGTLRSAVIGSFGRGARLVGYGDPREHAARWFYRDCVQRQGAHVVEQGAELLGEACGLRLEAAPAELPRIGWAEDWARNLVGSDRVCVLAAAAGWGAKRWPPARYAELARELRRGGYRVVVNAVRESDPLARQLVTESDGAAELAVCNVAGLVALVRRAAVVVGGDTGPVHLAAALGVPVVALFGPTDPARNGPWGPGPKRVLRDPASVTSYRRREEADPGLAKIPVVAVLECVTAVCREGRRQDGGGDDGAL